MLTMEVYDVGLKSQWRNHQPPRPRRRKPL